MNTPEEVTEEETILTDDVTDEETICTDDEVTEEEPIITDEEAVLTKDYVDSLSLACQTLSAQHGENAPECKAAYYKYGKALLELGRIELKKEGDEIT